MAEILNTETIAELDTVDLSIGRWMVHSDAEGNAAKMSTPMMLSYLNGVYGTKQDLFLVNQQLPSLAKKTEVAAADNQINARIDALSSGTLNVFPTDSPTAKVNSYNAMAAGTYTKFGGIAVTSAEFASNLVRINRSSTGVWSKQLIALSDNGSNPIFSNDSTFQI